MAYGWPVLAKFWSYYEPVLQVTAYLCYNLLNVATQFVWHIIITVSTTISTATICLPGEQWSYAQTSTPYLLRTSRERVAKQPPN